MGKKIVLVFVLMLLATTVYGEKPTREYKPVIKTLSATTDAWTEKRIWEITGVDDSDYKNIVCNGYIVSGDEAQTVTISASDTIVVLHITASQPTVSPTGFLWKGADRETINITTTANKVDVTLTGWIESN